MNFQRAIEKKRLNFFSNIRTSFASSQKEFKYLFSERKIFPGGEKEILVNHQFSDYDYDLHISAMIIKDREIYIWH